MNNKDNKANRSIDSLLADHLKDRQEKVSLSSQFNSRLMDQIYQMEEQKDLAKSYSSRSYLLPAVLLVLIAIGSFLYLMGLESLTLADNFNFSIDTSIFQHKGMKYMLYSFIALLVFSVADRFIQLKMHSSER